MWVALFLFYIFFTYFAVLNDAWLQKGGGAMFFTIPDATHGTGNIWRSGQGWAMRGQWVSHESCLGSAVVVASHTSRPYGQGCDGGVLPNSSLAMKVFHGETGSTHRVKGYLLFRTVEPG